MFGYKDAIEGEELTGVRDVVVDGSSVIQISFTRDIPEFGDVEFVVDLDATNLLPMKTLVTTLGSDAHDLAEIDYEVETVASMPELPEMPTTPQTGSETYSEQTFEGLTDFDDFPVHSPDSALLDDYAPEIIHHELTTSEERSSAVSIYYWPPGVAKRERTIPDLQVSNTSAASIDATHLEASGSEVLLPDGTKAVAVREGDALLTVTWDIGATRVTVFGNLKVFSEAQIRKIAGSLVESRGS